MLAFRHFHDLAAQPLLAGRLRRLSSFLVMVLLQFPFSSHRRIPGRRSTRAFIQKGQQVQSIERCRRVRGISGNASMNCAAHARQDHARPGDKALRHVTRDMRAVLDRIVHDAMEQAKATRR
jgi:hypothetical protein